MNTREITSQIRTYSFVTIFLYRSSPMPQQSLDTRDMLSVECRVGYVINLTINSSDTTHYAMEPTGYPYASQHGVEYS
jgi:hypothetical protein